MKKVLLFLWCLQLASAQAGEISCPGYYPAKEAILPGSLSGHNGSGLVRGAKLSSAYVHVGKQYADPNGFDAMQLIPKRVKGGWDTDDSFSPNETKWLVCIYGGDGRRSVENPRVAGSIEWWERIDAHISHCALHFREVKQAIQASSDWTATAVCN